MNILKNISNNYRIDVSQLGSSSEEIKKLIKFSEVEVPKDFLNSIELLSEIEINVDEEKYIRIWGADGCIEMNQAYNIQKNIPLSLAIGDDEGGNTLLYATGKEGFGLYIIAFNDLDIEELKYVSSSLTNLLVNNVGIDIIKD